MSRDLLHVSKLSEPLMSNAFDRDFAAYITRLERAPQTHRVQNALSLARRCADYGNARHLDMQIAGNGPTFRQAFEDALADAKRSGQ